MGLAAAVGTGNPDVVDVRTVRIEILDPIPPGLDKDVFFKRLQDALETATARLIAEAKAAGR